MFPENMVFFVFDFIVGFLMHKNENVNKNKKAYSSSSSSNKITFAISLIGLENKVLAFFGAK